MKQLWLLAVSALSAILIAGCEKSTPLTSGPAEPAEARIDAPSQPLLTPPVPPAKWVRVTRPMLACFSLEVEKQDEALEAMLRTVGTWRPGAKLDWPCTELKLGDKYVMAGAQPVGAVNLYTGCRPGCSPYMWATFAPVRSKDDEYLEDTTGVKGQEWLLKEAAE